MEWLKFFFAFRRLFSEKIETDETGMAGAYQGKQVDAYMHWSLAKLKI